MPESDDITLLKQYAQGDESAFSVLVERYVHLVYSTALRQVGNPSHAEEISQAVFIILTQKAKSLSPRTILSGWLYQTARLTAANFLRSEIRRQHREQEAYMQSTLIESDAAAWEQMAPLLDEAMGRLGEADRNAIVLRYFENKTAQEVATTLKLNEVTARKRVSRALEKLRKFFTKRGVSSTTAIIAGGISAHSVQAAPVALTKSITAVAIAKGSMATASILTLVKGTMKSMTWLKLKFVLGVSVAALLVGGVATVAISQTSGDSKLAAQEIAKKSQEAYAALASYSDNGTVVSEGGGQTTTTTFNIRMQRPNLYRIDWTQTGGLYTGIGAVWSQGNGDFFVMGAAGQEQNSKPQKMRDMQMALGAATGVSGSAASTIPAAFFKQNWGDVLGVAASGRSEIKKENDAKIGGVDCYVVSSVIDPANLPNKGKLPSNTGKMGITTTTLWIGKRDSLIHQTRTTLEGMSITPPQESDSDIKTILERQNKPATPGAIAALRCEASAN